VTAGGKPLDTFRVSAVDKASGVHRAENFFATQGRWAIRDLPAGKYEVSADAAEGTAVLDIPLAENQVKEGVVLELTPKSILRGQVVALEDNHPLPGMMVMVAARKGTGHAMAGPWSDNDRKNITDAEGRFEVQGAPTGRVNISVWPQDFQTAHYGWANTGATLESGKVNETRPIRLPKLRVSRQGERGGDLGFSLKDWKMGAEMDEQERVVTFLRPGRPAEKSGLAVGDVIVSVDGQDVTGDNAYLYFTFSQVPAGTTLQLGLSRQAQVTVVAGKPL
jgi:hypothetical protein